MCLTTQDLALLLFAPAAAAVLWASRLKAPSWRCPSLLPGLLGLDSPGPWLRYALGRSGWAARSPMDGCGVAVRSPAELVNTAALYIQVGGQGWRDPAQPPRAARHGQAPCRARARATNLPAILRHPLRQRHTRAPLRAIAAAAIAAHAAAAANARANALVITITADGRLRWQCTTRRTAALHSATTTRSTASAAPSPPPRRPPCPRGASQDARRWGGGGTAGGGAVCRDAGRAAVGRAASATAARHRPPPL